MRSGEAKGLSAVGRRQVLTSAGLGLAAAGTGLATPFIGRAEAATKTVTICQWSHFVPAFDTWFDKFAKDWGEKNGLQVTVDHIPVADVAARAAAEAAAKGGHDLFMWNGAGGPHLYQHQLIDMTKFVEGIEKKYGQASTIGRQIAYNLDSKTWSAYPDYYINFPAIYRKDLWDEVGVSPDTWDDVRKGGAKLKKKGHPVGISLGHSNDPNNTWRGVLWSYGGSFQDKTGKHVVLDSKESVEAVKFVTALYKEAMTSEVLSWNDSSNNRYVVSGVGSLIVNPLSAYRTCQKVNPKLADKLYFAKAPKGPAHRLMGGAANSYGIWNFARNKEGALAFLTYYTDHWLEAFKASEGYNMPVLPKMVPTPMPLLSNDPTSHPPTKLQVLQTSGDWTAATGWPGPAWQATDEIYNDFVISDMMAKSATGAMSPEDAVKWGTQQTKRIFKKWQA